MDEGRYMRIMRFVCLTLISLLLLAAVGNASNLPNRFDPLLKTNWYGLYMQGMKVGYVRMALDKIKEPISGWRMETEMTFITKAGGQEMRLVTNDAKIFRSPNGELYSSSLNVTSSTGNVIVSGHIDGSQYVVESDIGGQKSAKSFAYPLDYLDSVLVVEMRIMSGKVAVGDSFSFSTFEATPPLTGLIHQTVKIKSKGDYIFNGLPTMAYKSEMTIKEANITVEGQTDSYGNNLEINWGNALTGKLEDEATAKDLSTSFDIMLDNLIMPDKKLENSQELRSLKLKISGIDSTGLLNTDMQAVNVLPDGLELDITAQPVPLNPSVRPNTEQEVSEYLKSDPYEQSDDPQIIELANTIIAGEKNSWEAAKKINSWVYANIEKKFTPDLSNALQTLKSRQGDCGEHTALAVALLRAAGIPARPIVGLMYWEPGGGFGYHAWVETYVGRWIQMDPTWNQELASPAHIALTRGDIISQASVLLKVMGKMKIEVAEAK